MAAACGLAVGVVEKSSAKRANNLGLLAVKSELCQPSAKTEGLWLFIMTK